MMELFIFFTPLYTSMYILSCLVYFVTSFLMVSCNHSDLARNPLIVPLKVLRGHGVKGGLGVLSTTFHPRQPWVFTAGSDGVINLFQDAGM